MNSLIIKDLSKSYSGGLKAIDDVSMHLSNGMFGLLGPNGAGKSTLMRTIAGLQSPSSGHLIFNGEDLVQHPLLIKKQLGFLPQDFGVYPKVSAFDLLTHIAILKGLTNKKTRSEQILALLNQTNLYASRNKEVHTFSGGMRQRFGIAQALLGNPQLIIVDEPTAGLDPEERNRFNNLLSEIGEDKIVILSTHLVEDVKNLCTDMAVMCKGKIVARGKPADFIEMLDGKLWHRTIEKHQHAAFKQKYRLIASKLAAGKLTIHVYADENPGEGWQPCTPSLEDVYFNLIHEKI